jgi:hypothetical protein
MSNYTLHKLPEGFIITSDDRIKLSDTCLNIVHRIVVNPTDEDWANSNSDNLKKVIAQQDQIDFSTLSEEEQKEIGWFDVEKLAKESIGNKYFQDEILDAIADYKKGFQKAQELLSDRRFTLEDVQLAFAKGAECTTKPYPQNVQFENEYKQSLSQKSWKVEVEVEKETLYTDDGLDYKGNLIPKLTNDKIKILKLVKNK